MFLQYFKSISIIFDKKLDVNHQVSLSMANWLHRFDEWYKAETGINDGNNLHLLYKREVSISGHSLLDNNPEIYHVINSCVQCGFYVSLRISLDEIYNFYTTIEQLTHKFKNLILIIDASNANADNCNWPSNFVINLVESLVKKRIRLAFVGAVSFWLDSGISRSQIVGETVYDIIPSIRLRKNRFIADYNPCAKWLGFVVNSDGLIYPCMGLVGIEMCSIGTIHQPISVVWEAIKHHSLSLEKLAIQGPVFDKTFVELDNLNFASICQAHRYQVINKLCTKNDK